MSGPSYAAELTCERITLVVFRPHDKGHVTIGLRGAKQQHFRYAELTDVEAKKLAGELHAAARAGEADAGHGR